MYVLSQEITIREKVIGEDKENSKLVNEDMEIEIFIE